MNIREAISEGFAEITQKNVRNFSIKVGVYPYIESHFGLSPFGDITYNTNELWVEYGIFIDRDTLISCIRDFTPISEYDFIETFWGMHSLEERTNASILKTDYD